LVALGFPPSTRSCRWTLVPFSLRAQPPSFSTLYLPTEAPGLARPRVSSPLGGEDADCYAMSSPLFNCFPYGPSPSKALSFQVSRPTSPPGSGRRGLLRSAGIMRLFSPPSSRVRKPLLFLGRRPFLDFLPFFDSFTAFVSQTMIDLTAFSFSDNPRLNSFSLRGTPFLSSRRPPLFRGRKYVDAFSRRR